MSVQAVSRARIRPKQAQHSGTFNEVASQDKHVLDNVGALGGRLEDAGAVAGAQNKSGIAGGIRLDRLSALFLADLVYRLDLLEVLVGDCLCSYSSLPRDWSRPDVVLERQDVCWRVERHVDVRLNRGLVVMCLPLSGSSIALGVSVLQSTEAAGSSDVVGLGHLPLAIRGSTGATSQSLLAAVIARHFFDIDPIKKGDAPNPCRLFIMTSLKRSYAADSAAPNLSSKVYIRSTKSGKVQKIVRELYLREDIPCSSRLCAHCLEIAPTDYHNKGIKIIPITLIRTTSDFSSRSVCAV